MRKTSRGRRFVSLILSTSPIHIIRFQDDQYGKGVKTLLKNIIFWNLGPSSNTQLKKTYESSLNYLLSLSTFQGWNRRRSKAKSKLSSSSNGVHSPPGCASFWVLPLPGKCCPWWALALGRHVCQSHVTIVSLCLLLDPWVKCGWAQWGTFHYFSHVQRGLKNRPDKGSLFPSGSRYRVGQSQDN